MKENKSSWFSRHHCISCVFIVMLILLLVLMGGSILLQQQKKETCNNIAEVWQDVGHLLSQKQNGKLALSHGFSSLHRYLFSNLLDASLCEWRLLEDAGELPDSPDTRYLSWQSESREQTDPQEGMNAVPVLLSVSASSTAFHDNPTELDYTHQVRNVEVDGRVLYTCQNGNLLWSGYTSKVTIASFVTDTPQDTQTTQQSQQGTSFEQYRSIPAALDHNLTLGTGQAASITLDYGAKQS